MICHIHILYASVEIIYILCKIMLVPQKNGYENQIHTHNPIIMSHSMIILLLMAKNYGISHCIIL